MKRRFKTKKMKVEKKNYEVFEFDADQPYYGICEKFTLGRNCIYGGDSANEDDYHIDHINRVFDEWDGQLAGDANGDYYIENPN